MAAVAIGSGSLSAEDLESRCKPYRFSSRDVPASHRWHGASGFLLEVMHADSRPSYVFGTFHSADPRVLIKWDRVLLVIASSAVDELIVERLEVPGARGPDPRLLDEGENLEELLHEYTGLYELVVESWQSYGLPGSELQRLEPWYVSASIQQAPAMQIGTGNPILDDYLAREAARLYVGIRGLETISGLAAVYEQTLSFDEQIRSLWETVCNQDLIESQIAMQTAAYVADDVPAMYRSLERLESSDPVLADKLTDALVRDRSEEFWKVLEPELARGGQFVAVGNLHVFGPAGLWYQLGESQTGGRFRVRNIDVDELVFSLEADDIDPLVAWALQWTQSHLGETFSRAEFETLRIEPRSIVFLRDRLCPGRQCVIDATYSPRDDMVYLTTSMFAMAMISTQTPEFYLVGSEVRKRKQQLEVGETAYADSILIRELVRYLLYHTRYPDADNLSAGNQDAMCIKNRVLHSASQAQQQYLRSSGSERSARFFALDPSCMLVD